MLGELTKDEIEKILTTHVVGRIGCYARRRVYVVPVAYCYDGKDIIGHTVEGMKMDFLRQNPECCFEVDVLKNLNNWKCVIAWGTFEELQGEVAAEAMQKLFDKLTPLIDSETSHPPRMGPSSPMRSSTFTKNPIVYRIKLKEKTGRYEEQ
jgi:nitroimidazol reductase NimA-like FMN-containing flavoprotein (pyridoxamine 5'-phosphate oxidase superfamily)